MATYNYSIVEGYSFQVRHKADVLYSFVVKDGKLIGGHPLPKKMKFDSLNALHKFYKEHCVQNVRSRVTSKDCYDVNTGQTLFELLHQYNEKEIVQDLSNEIESDPTLTIPEILRIYLCIKRLSVNYGKCYPSNATLAKYTHTNIDAVYKYIGLLNNAGYIKFDCIYRQGKRLRAIVPLV